MSLLCWRLQGWDSNPRPRGYEPRELPLLLLCLSYMEGEGFEPPNPKERIYSPPRLTASLPFRVTPMKSV